MKKQIILISLVLLAAVAGPGSAQVGKSGAAKMAGPASTVEMKVVDEKGMALRPESLPKDVQANLEKVRKAAESIAAPGPGGAAAAQKVKVTISCSHPPLSCTITVAF
jgi:hypothetical protein